MVERGFSRTSGSCSVPCKEGCQLGWSPYKMKRAGPAKPPLNSMNAGGGTFIRCSTSKTSVASLNCRE